LKVMRNEKKNILCAVASGTRRADVSSREGIPCRLVKCKM